MNATTEDGTVPVSQLCIGMHVTLDLSWMEHPFTFSSFKIKNLEQIATIQALGLSQVRWSPARSDCTPLAPAEANDATEAPATVRLDADAATQAKRARLQRVDAHRTKLGACERELISASRRIKSMNQNLFSKPAETRAAATALVDGIADSMLVDSDIAIHLMADKVGGEEIYHHSLNVALLSMMLARELKAPSQAIRLMGLGAMFHDVGKVELPDRVVYKTEPLSRAETNLLQTHCVKGLDVASRLDLPPEATVVIAQHHERMDGKGYPRGLQGPQISLLAKIVGLVNTFDNLCNPVDFQKSLTPHEALSTMYGQQRAQFDPNAMAVFVRCMGVYPPGTVVVLSNGGLGIVVSINSSRPLKPTVLIYDPAVPKESAIIVDLEDEPDVTITRTMRPNQLPQAAYDYLSPRKRTTYYFDADTKPR
jgi:putative nucleotidyltransferase with HDIG domain